MQSPPEGPASTPAGGAFSHLIPVEEDMKSTIKYAVRRENSIAPGEHVYTSKDMYNVYIPGDDMKEVGLFDTVAEAAAALVKRHPLGKFNPEIVRVEVIEAHGGRTVVALEDTTPGAKFALKQQDGYFHDLFFSGIETLYDSAIHAGINEARLFDTASAALVQQRDYATQYAEKRGRSQNVYDLVKVIVSEPTTDIRVLGPIK